MLLFVFSLPFEYWDPFGISSFFSVTKMSGFGYASIAFLTIRESFNFKIFKNVKLLLVLWVWLLLMSLFNYTGLNTVSVFNFTILQNILLYWLIASDLESKNIQIKTIMLTFVVSVVLMTILLTLGIGLGEEYVENVSRVTFFGNNPNTIGVSVSLATVFSLYFVLNASTTYGKNVYLVLFAIPSFTNLLLSSGSRGALITLTLSLSLLFITNKAVPYKRIMQIGFLMLGAIYFMGKIVESNLMYNRLTLSLEEGNTAGRGEIWENVLDISFNRPLIGYGSTGFEHEMVRIYGGNKDPHNLFLYIFVSTGIIGLGLFFCFLYLHLKKAVQSFRHGDVIKLIIFLFYLTTVMKAGGVIKDKLMWLLLAVIFSASFLHSQKKSTN